MQEAVEDILLSQVLAAAVSVGIQHNISTVDWVSPLCCRKAIATHNSGSNTEPFCLSSCWQAAYALEFHVLAFP